MENDEIRKIAKSYLLLYEWYLLNGLPVWVLEKAGLGFDFTKTQLTSIVLGILKMIKNKDFFSK